MLTTITLISDTHCKTWEEVHPEIKRKVLESDYAIHCGDYVRKNVLDGFVSNSNNPIVVHGNSDPIEIRKLIPYTQTLKINNINIGIIHPAWGKEEFDFKELLSDFPEEINTYRGFIPVQAFGTTINYFLRAADSSGRVESNPIAGHHSFYAVPTDACNNWEIGDMDNSGQLDIYDILLVSMFIVIQL